MRPGAQPAYRIYRGVDFGEVAFRVVEACPPRDHDFLSYLMKGWSFHDKMFFRATGVSMYTKRHQARKIARARRLGDYLATVSVADERVHVARVNDRTGHVLVWARPSVLATLVVNCVEVDDG